MEAQQMVYEPDFDVCVETAALPHLPVHSSPRFDDISISDLNDLKALTKFVGQLAREKDTRSHNIGLVSLLLGYVEAQPLINKTVFPIRSEVIKDLWCNFTDFVAKIQKSLCLNVSSFSNGVSRDIIQAISSSIHDHLAEPVCTTTSSDSPQSQSALKHAHSLYSFVVNRQLDTFGLSVVTLSVCHLLGMQSVTALALSEEHSWLRFRDDPSSTGLPSSAELTGKLCGDPIPANFRESWRYMCGLELVADSSVAICAIVAHMSPWKGDQELGVLVSTKQQLLHQLHDLGILSRHPSALACLAHLEERQSIDRAHFDPGKAIELYKKAIGAAQGRGNAHVLPHLMLAKLLSRSVNLVSHSLSTMAAAAEVLQLYKFCETDATILREMASARDQIVEILKKNENLRNSEVFGFVMRFIGGILKWEEDSPLSVIDSEWSEAFCDIAELFVTKDLIMTVDFSKIPAKSSKLLRIEQILKSSQQFDRSALKLEFLPEKQPAAQQPTSSGSPPPTASQPVASQMDLSEKSNKMDDLSMSVEGQSPSAGEESGSAMIESHGSCENEASGVESTKIPVDSLSESAMQSVSQRVQSVSQQVQPASQQMQPASGSSSPRVHQESISGPPAGDSVSSKTKSPEKYDIVSQSTVDPQMTSNTSPCNSSEVSQADSQTSQVDSQVSQVGGQASQVDSQASQIYGQDSQVDSQVSQTGSQPSQVDSQVSQVDSQASQLDSQASQFDGQASQVDGQPNHQASQLDDQANHQASQMGSQASQVDDQASQVDGQASQVDDQASQMGCQADQEDVHMIHQNTITANEAVETTVHDLVNTIAQASVGVISSATSQSDGVSQSINGIDQMVMDTTGQSVSTSSLANGQTVNPGQPRNTMRDQQNMISMGSQSMESIGQQPNSQSGQSINNATGQQVNVISQPMSMHSQPMNHQVGLADQQLSMGGQPVSMTNQSMNVISQQMNSDQSMNFVSQQVTTDGQQVNTTGQQMVPCGQPMISVNQSMNTTGQQLNVTGQPISQPMTNQSMDLVGQQNNTTGQQASSTAQTASSQTATDGLSIPQQEMTQEKMTLEQDLYRIKIQHPSRIKQLDQLQQTHQIQRDQLLQQLQPEIDQRELYVRMEEFKCLASQSQWLQSQEIQLRMQVQLYELTSPAVFGTSPAQQVMSQIIALQRQVASQSPQLQALAQQHEAALHQLQTVLNQPRMYQPGQKVQLSSQVTQLYYARSQQLQIQQNSQQMVQGDLQKIQNLVMQMQLNQDNLQSEAAPPPAPPAAGGQQAGQLQGEEQQQIENQLPTGSAGTASEPSTVTSTTLQNNATTSQSVTDVTKVEAEVGEIPETETPKSPEESNKENQDPIAQISPKSVATQTTCEQPPPPPPVPAQPSPAQVLGQQLTRQSQSVNQLHRHFVAQSQQLGQAQQMFQRLRQCHPKMQQLQQHQLNSAAQLRSVLQQQTIASEQQAGRIQDRLRQLNEQLGQAAPPPSQQPSFQPPPGPPQQTFQQKSPNQAPTHQQQPFQQQQQQYNRQQFQRQQVQRQQQQQQQQAQFQQQRVQQRAPPEEKDPPLAPQQLNHLQKLNRLTIEQLAQYEPQQRQLIKTQMLQYRDQLVNAQQFSEEYKRLVDQEHLDEQRKIEEHQQQLKEAQQAQIEQEKQLLREKQKQTEQKNKRRNKQAKSTSKRQKILLAQQQAEANELATEARQFVQSENFPSQSTPFQTSHKDTRFADYQVYPEVSGSAESSEPTAQITATASVSSVTAATNVASDEELYCFCRKPYRVDEFMVGCDGCDEWYHPNCVRTTEQIVAALDQYFCPPCLARDQTKKDAQESQLQRIEHARIDALRTQEESGEQQRTQRVIEEQRLLETRHASG
eukprot:317084_1